jgi:hypothetical protein
MKWTTKRGRVWRTLEGTSKACAYYWVMREVNGQYVAGRYWFNRDVQYQNISFDSLAKAKAFCKMKDDTALVIEAVNA